MTMGLGIVISMFTAVSIVRMVMELWIGSKQKPKATAYQATVRVGAYPGVIRPSGS